MPDADYVARASPAFEPAIARALNQVISERAPDPVSRLGRAVPAWGDGGVRREGIVRVHVPPRARRSSGCIWTMSGRSVCWCVLKAVIVHLWAF